MALTLNRQNTPSGLSYLVWIIGAWNFDFVCYLGFGAWNFLILWLLLVALRGFFYFRVASLVHPAHPTSCS